MAAEQKREDIADERRRWKQAIADVHPSRLVFLDESGAKTNITRLYGRAPRGQRVIEYAPGGHWCTTTMLGALRWDRFEAPLVLDGAMVCWSSDSCALVLAVSPGSNDVNVAGHECGAVVVDVSNANARTSARKPLFLRG